MKRYKTQSNSRLNNLLYGIGVKTSRIIKRKECNQCNGIRELPNRIWEVISSKTNITTEVEEATEGAVEDKAEVAITRT